MGNFRSERRRPWRETAERVVDTFDENPELTSAQIGAKLSLHPAYVRKTLQRYGRRLRKAHRTF